MKDFSIRRSAGIVAVAVALTGFVTGALPAGGRSEPDADETISPMKSVELLMSEGAKEATGDTDVAVLAGGCFWGVEAVFEVLSGVVDVRSGYSGGTATTANYHVVSSGRTEHAESVEIVFDPEVISYKTLLDVFFTVAHDPTQLNYQGPDVGPQYRSAIFFADDKQAQGARDYIEELEESKVYGEPVVTQVVPLEQFYPAEDYHQDFLVRNPGNPYIVYWDIPKLAHLEREFPELLKE